jgi:RNA polymerase sigma-70 factor (ECF subfamily)
VTPKTSANEDQLSEAELVAGARGGNAAAWEAIVGRHREAVFRYAYLQSGDPAEAEDIAQETFMRAFRSFHHFDVSRPLRPWLLRIARNLARNRWRSWSRRIRATERWNSEASTEAAGSGSLPDGGPAVAADELKGIVARMREGDRQVIYLRFFLGLTLDETAEALSLPLGTVKSRLSRALDRLRDEVHENHPALRQALEE